MTRFEPIDSEAILLSVDDVDTDQIIPARFLKGTDRAGLGAALFADWRYDAEGAPTPDFPLNVEGAERASVLVVGRNFGCGSSREHAAWALSDWGIRAVIGTDFADIFRNNALKNGLLPVQLDPDTHAEAASQVAPGARFRIDLAASIVTFPDGTAVTFAIERFARHCLLEGVDELGYLLERRGAITAFERSRGAAVGV